ncbi:hypothetical protein [Kribbella sp. NPDC051770]|uniref:hypothetical protein n=1 Tax=Kribbella sp. NPDC051770 TaxID=3155413 RepID=UPI00342D98D2
MSARLRVLAVLLAVLAFLPAGPAHATAPAAAPPELPDQIATAWIKDRVYLDPALRVAFPKPELDRIRAAVATPGLSVYVAIVPRTPYLKDITYDLPTLLQARTGQPGLYLVATVSDDYWATTAELFRAGGLRGRSLSSVQSEDEADRGMVVDRPAPKIVRTIQQAATALDGRALPVIPASDLTPPRTPRTGRSVTDKEDLTAFTGMGVGGVIGFLLVLVPVLRGRSKRKPVTSKKQSSSGATRLSAVRSQADRWIPKAGRAVSSLERLKKPTRTQLDRRDDARARLDAAKILRRAETGSGADAGRTSAEALLALTGAFVLARQAHHVASGNDVQPPCFFDPTHPSGTATAAWSDETDVPACATCAQTVSRGETPRGLQVPGASGLFGRDLIPYWELDPEDSPMVATGFGALSDDLAERVERAYGGVR